MEKINSISQKLNLKKFNKEITLIDLESGKEIEITPEELLRTGNLIPTRSSGESLV